MLDCQLFFCNYYTVGGRANRRFHLRCWYFYFSTTRNSTQRSATRNV